MNTHHAILALSFMFPSNGPSELDSLVQRISADAALQHQLFHEVPLPKSKDFMPTFPAINELDKMVFEESRSSRGEAVVRTAGKRQPWPFWWSLNQLPVFRWYLLLCFIKVWPVSIGYHFTLDLQYVKYCRLVRCKQMGVLDIQ